MFWKNLLDTRAFFRVINSGLVLILVFPGTLKADVSPVNLTISIDTEIIIDLSATISNITNPNVTISTPPANGVAVKTPNTTLSLTYTPNNGYSGIDSFEYQVVNASGQPETATVTIAVNPPPITGTSPQQLSDFTGKAFTNRANEFSGLTSPISGDLNGDNAIDIIGYINGQFTELLNSGTGQFTELANPNINEAMVLHDMDGDNDLDIITAKLEVWQNDGGGVFSLVQPAAVTEIATDLDSADMDGDGDVDVVVVINNQLQLWLNEGQGKLVSGQVLNSAANLAEIGDLDCDNSNDIFIATNGVDEIWINNGAGQFTQLTQPFTNSQTTDVQLGDIDGDNDLDALVANNTQSLLWLNDGIGNFAFHPQFSLPKEAAHRSHLVDLNNDGRLDNIVESLLSFGQGYLRMVWAQLNIGDETFINLPDSSYFFDSGSTLQSDLTIGDFDDDGFQDILIGDSQNSQIQFNNLGSKYGTFLINTNTQLELIDVQVTGRFVHVLESDLSVVVSIKPMSTHSSQIKVDYSTLDYTAQAGQDYVASSGTLSWLAGDDSEKTIAIEVLSDEVKEFGEALYLRLEFSLDQDVVQRVVTPILIINDEIPQSAVGECAANNSNTRDPEGSSVNGGGGASSWNVVLVLFFGLLPRLLLRFACNMQIRYSGTKLADD